MEAPDAVAEMSKVPALATPDEAATPPEPERASVAPAEMLVAPVKVFTPDNPCVPPVIASPPVPPTTPAKVPEAAVSVSVFAPKTTAPAPVSALMEAPDAVAEMSKVPAFATPDEAATPPEPERASAAPDRMVVAPV